MNTDVKTISPESINDDTSINDLAKMLHGDEPTQAQEPVKSTPEEPAQQPEKQTPAAEKQPDQPAAAPAVQTPAGEPAKKNEGEEHTPEKQQEPGAQTPEKKKSPIDQRMSDLARKRREAEARAKETQTALETERQRAERLERELAALKSGQPGPTDGTKPAGDTKPAEGGFAKPKPILKDYTQEGGKFHKEGEDYDDAAQRHAEALADWNYEKRAYDQQQRAEATQRSEQTKQFQKEWESAMDENPDFEDSVERVRTVAPEGLQIAISQIKTRDGKALWPAVTVYLDEHPEELSALAQTFGTNPYAAAAELGRIAASIEKPSSPAPAQQTPEPAASEPAAPPKTKAEVKPPAEVGGGAAAGQVDVEAMDLNALARHMSDVGLIRS